VNAHVPQEWKELCTADDVPEGEARGFTLGTHRYCVVNDGASFFVVDDLCTHGVAYLSEGYCDTEECVLECPLHGGLFDYRTGGACGDPAEKSVRNYPIRIEDGKVMVQL